MVEEIWQKSSRYWIVGSPTVSQGRRNEKSVLAGQTRLFDKLNISSSLPLRINCLSCHTMFCHIICLKKCIFQQGSRTSRLTKPLVYRKYQCSETSCIWEPDSKISHLSLVFLQNSSCILHDPARYSTFNNVSIVVTLVVFVHVVSYSQK